MAIGWPSSAGRGESTVTMPVASRTTRGMATARCARGDGDNPAHTPRPAAHPAVRPAIGELFQREDCERGITPVTRPGQAQSWREEMALVNPSRTGDAAALHQWRSGTAWRRQAKEGDS